MKYIFYILILVCVSCFNKKSETYLNFCEIKGDSSKVTLLTSNKYEKIVDETPSDEKDAKTKFIINYNDSTICITHESFQEKLFFKREYVNVPDQSVTYCLYHNKDSIYYDKIFIVAKRDSNVYYVQIDTEKEIYLFYDVEDKK